MSLLFVKESLREKCPYSEFSGPYFSAFGLNTEIRSIASYSVQIRENTDQKNSEYGHFLRSEENIEIESTIRPILYSSQPFRSQIIRTLA